MKNKNEKYKSRLSYDYLLRSAYRYLERYATTEANLNFILNRKVDRVLGKDEAAIEKKAQATEWTKKIVHDMVEKGIVNDKLFAESRTRSLMQSGNSLSIIQKKLLVKGVPQNIITDVLKQAKEDNPDINKISAVKYVRKRRFGAFRIKEKEVDIEKKELAAMARAGFSYKDSVFILSATRSELEDILYNE